MSDSILKISERDFERLRGFIYQACGINLSKQKKVLVESRLQKRLVVHAMSSFSTYCDYVMNSLEGQAEIVHLIDSVATNKTDFFREPGHFEFLEKEALPSFSRLRLARPFKVWSSACSTGEEPYTLAMVLEDFYNSNPSFEYRVVASDISTKVLEKAVKGIYDEKTITGIPMNLRKRYLLRSKNQDNPTIRIAPGLRSKVAFKRVNLTDSILEVEPDFDAVFCRNVLIYFDRQTQEQVVRKLLSKLRLGGYLFIGHSESIYHMQLPVKQLRPTVFQRV